MSASFYDAVAEPTSDVSCDTEAEGDCVWRRCEFKRSGGSSSTQWRYRSSAGTLSLTSDLGNADTSRYPDYEFTLAPVRDREQFTIKASGGDVPAFSAVLTMPSMFVMTEPVCPENGYVVERTMPMRVAWSDAPFGLMNVQLAEITCTVPASQGEVTISPRLLSMLEPYEASSFSIYSTTSDTILAGSYEVKLRGSFSERCKTAIH